MRPFPSAVALGLCLALPRVAAAFCGFYVSGADASLVNRATHVALMRAGTRTVLSMANAYEGPPEDFALVVPVPVVLQKEQVKTLPREILEHVDHLGAPRLVEYWEQDPCAPHGGVPSGVGVGFGSGQGRLAGSHRSEAPEVKVEAQFEVGEYEIVILSATDSTALDTWLRQNGYKIPAGAEPHLRPYVQSGMKFFVAKVDIEKVERKDGRAILSPLRFHYDSDTFSLPIRLGLINAGDAQDLVVSILSQGKRYEVANYPNVTIPTNLDVSEQTRASFGSFYAALLDETSKQKPGAVVTEYAWDAGTCDPCPGPVLSGTDMVTLGADVLSDSQKPAGIGNGPMRVQLDSPEVSGPLPPTVVQRILRQNTGRFRLCYEEGRTRRPSLQGGRISVKLVIGKEGAVTLATDAGSTLAERGAVDCAIRAARDLSFPKPEGGVVTVKQDIRFVPGSAGMRPNGFVLTRLHMRYSKEALGEDLVFKEAQAITGGREVRGAGGQLERGAVLAQVNNFQARYAIRHPWTGPVACDNPVRGMWGGPPDGTAPAAKAAQDLAFVERGAALGAFLTAALPPVSGPTAPGAEPPAAASASAPPAASASAPPAASAQPGTAGSRGCGCATASAGTHPGWLAAAALLGLLRRRRATRKARTTSALP